ncbi:MAG: winged helix-turn-helix domain-containing protein [Thaumarchaeota archaeon]|nr:winged helix-turn-helix domain-containing protein [Nitrososphaerota archaeon]
MKISNAKLKQSILIALADEEILKILNAAMLRAKPVNEIIKETGIPHTTAYRKVNWLLEQGLLAVQRIHITPDGKKFSEVRSTLKSFNVRYELNSVIVEGEPNFNPMERTANDFFSLDSTSQ